MDPVPTNTFAIAVIGAPGIGKTSMLQTLTNLRTSDSRLPVQTPHTKVLSKHTYKTRLDDVTIKLSVVDTPGQVEDFDRMPPGLYTLKYDLVICAYALNSKQSLEALPYYIEKMRAGRDPARTPPFLLVGLKYDLWREREVTRQMADAFAEQHNLRNDGLIREMSSRTRRAMGCIMFVMTHTCLEWTEELEQLNEQEVQQQQQQQQQEGEEEEAEVQTGAAGETQAAEAPAKSAPEHGPDQPTGGDGRGVVAMLMERCCLLM